MDRTVGINTCYVGTSDFELEEADKDYVISVSWFLYHSCVIIGCLVLFSCWYIKILHMFYFDRSAVLSTLSHHSMNCKKISMLEIVLIIHKIETREACLLTELVLDLIHVCTMQNTFLSLSFLDYSVIKVLGRDY